MYDDEGLTWAEVEILARETEHPRSWTKSRQSQPFTQPQAKPQPKAQVSKPQAEPLIYMCKRAGNNASYFLFLF